MNKYELALVLNAKVEDDVRTATLEKVKDWLSVSTVPSPTWTSGARRNLLTRSRK